MRDLRAPGGIAGEDDIEGAGASDLASAASDFHVVQRRAAVAGAGRSVEAELPREVRQVAGANLGRVRGEHHSVTVASRGLASSGCGQQCEDEQKARQNW